MSGTGRFPFSVANTSKPIKILFLGLLLAWDSARPSPFQPGSNHPV